MEVPRKEPSGAPPLRRRIRAGALSALTRASGAIPHGHLVRALSGIARVFELTSFQDRTLSNLELALGSETTAEDRRAIARGVWRHSGRLLAEWIRLTRADAGTWLDRTVIVDPSVRILDEVFARGRGALVVTGHVGNWELFPAVMARRGMTGAVVARRRPNDGTSDWLLEMRRNNGVPTIDQLASPRRILEVLRGGGVLGMLCDLEVRRIAGEFVPFFGVPALTMTAPAALARAAGLDVLPARCIAEDGCRYRILVEEPLSLDPVLPRREATLDLVGRLNRTVERWIRETPEQWAWHQPRWRTRPGDPGPRPCGVHGGQGGQEKGRPTGGGERDRVAGR